MTANELKALDELCVNWSRWAKSGGGGRGRCGSIESRYLPERLTEAEAVDRAQKAPMPVNHASAERVEAAVTNLLQIGRFIEHRMLTLHYLDGLPLKVLQARFELDSCGIVQLHRTTLSSLDSMLKRRDAAIITARGKPIGWLK